MKPYMTNGATYSVALQSGVGFARVPSRLAAGMLATLQRSQRSRLYDTTDHLNPRGVADGLRLSYRGTTDPLARRVNYKLWKPAPCACCGAPRNDRRRMDGRHRNRLGMLLRRYHDRAPVRRSPLP